MQLTDEEVEDLALFLAKRFPTPAYRETLVRRADLVQVDPTQTDPVAGWAAVLHVAIIEGRIGTLAEVLRDEAEGDPNLRIACDLLAGKRRTPRTVAAAGLGASLIAVLVVGGAATARMLGQEPVLEMEPTALAAPAHITTEDAAQGPPSLVPEADPVPVPGVAEAPPAQAPAVVPAPPKAVARAARHPAGWCEADAQGIVGYWYAGTTAPGKAGDVISVPRSANVRADYPHEGNDFSKTARVRCSLTIGDRVRLSLDPVRVAGTHFWVPLSVGDRVAAAGRTTAIPTVPVTVDLLTP
jgi:hypothetical protein